MQGHIRSILPQKGGMAPIDNNTVFYAPYTAHEKDMLHGQSPIGFKDALRFNGVSSYGEVQDFNFKNFEEVSFSLWVNPSSWISHRSLLANRTTTGNGFIFFALSGANLTIDMGGAQKRWNTGYLPPLATWTHLVFASDGKTHSLYVNGQLQASVAAIGTPSDIQTGGSLKIGIDASSSQYHFDGIIQDVKVWGHCLGIEEVRESMYNNHMATKGYWPMNEGEGQLIYDESGLGNDGVLSNGEWGAGKSEYQLTKKGVLLQEQTTNMIPKESLFFDKGWSDYSGAVIKRTQGIAVEEWGTNEATKIEVSGGTSVIVSHIDILTHQNIELGRQFTGQVKIKNIGTVSVYIFPNRQSTSINSGIVKAGETRTVKWVTNSSAAGTGGNLQIQIRNLGEDVGKGLSFIAYQPQIEEKTYPTSFTEQQRKDSHLHYLNPVEGSGDFTVSFWVCPFDLNPNIETAQLMSMANEGDINISSLHVDIYQGKYRTFYYNELSSAKIITSPVKPVTEVWAHIAVVREGPEMRMYSDGELAGSIPLGAGSQRVGGIIALGERIGSGSVYNGRFFNGLISNFRIDKVARSQEEVRSWYYNGRGNSL